jgi:hypothetical protein
LSRGDHRGTDIESRQSDVVVDKLLSQLARSAADLENGTARRETGSANHQVDDLFWIRPA